MRAPSARRSNRRITATGRPALITRRPCAARMPARAARCSASTSPLVTARWVLDTREFRDGHVAVLVPDGAFRPESSQRSGAALKIGQVLLGFRTHLHRPRSAEQVRKLDQWRRSSFAVLRTALKAPLFVSKPQGAHPALIVHGEEEIQLPERTRSCLEIPRLRGPALLGMRAQNHAPTPAVRLGVGNGAVKDGTRRLTRVKLETAHQRQRWVDSKAFVAGQPIRRVGEGRVFAPALPVVAQFAERRRLAPEKNVNAPLHDAPTCCAKSRGGTIRFGRRSASSSSPTSSLRSSASSPSGAPKPSTNRAWA